MLTFNLKKEWFEKIKSGEKTHEYREVKPYWNKRIYNELLPLSDNGKIIYINDNRLIYCEFVCGYANKDDKKKRLKAEIRCIKKINGKNTDLAVDKDVYDIEFELLKECEDE